MYLIRNIINYSVINNGRLSLSN